MNSILGESFLPAVFGSTLLSGYLKAATSDLGDIGLMTLNATPTAITVEGGDYASGRLHPRTRPGTRGVCFMEAPAICCFMKRFYSKSRIQFPGEKAFG